MVKIDGLTTETVNEATKHIDERDALGIVTLINEEDKKVAVAIVMIESGCQKKEALAALIKARDKVKTAIEIAKKN